MDDFRLRVFITAAKTLNFTKCAEQLFISQPAVSKHIGELESRYKVQLFERSGSRLALTEAGRVMLEHAERIADGYRRLQYEMDLFTDRLGGELKVGASTTIAQYVLPQVLARFTARFPEVKVSLASGNSEQVEAALARHDTDLGLVESSARHPGFHYEPFIPDELVLIASTKGRYGRCDQVTLAELQTVPLVLRESGSGTLEVISKYLAAADVRLASLRVVMQLGSTESIKSFVRNSDAMAIVSVASIVDELRSGELRIIDIEGCTIRREFSFCWPEGRSDALAAFRGVRPPYGLILRGASARFYGSFSDVGSPPDPFGYSRMRWSVIGNHWSFIRGLWPCRNADLLWTPSPEGALRFRRGMLKYI